MKKTFLPWYFWSSHFVNSDLFFKTMFLKSIPISAWWHFYQILNLKTTHYKKPFEINQIKNLKN